MNQERVPTLSNLAPGHHRCSEWLDAVIREDASGPLLLIGHTTAKTQLAAAIHNEYAKRTIWSGLFTSEIAYGCAVRASVGCGDQAASVALRDSHASTRLLIVDGLGLSSESSDLDLITDLLLVRQRQGHMTRTIVTTHYPPSAFDSAFGPEAAALLSSGACAVLVSSQPFQRQPNA